MFTIPVTLFSGSSATRTLTFTTTSSSAGTTSFTTGSQSLGTPSGTSLVAVVVVVAAGAGIAGTQIDTVSIDGTNGTIHANVVFGADTTTKVMTAIASRATSNTSGTVTVNLSKNSTRAWIAIYRLNDLVSTTPDDNGVNSGNGLTSISDTASVTGLGIILAGALSSAVSASLGSFSAGVAADYQDTANNLQAVIGSAQNVGAGSVTVTASFPASGRECIATTNWH